MMKVRGLTILPVLTLACALWANAAEEMTAPAAAAAPPIVPENALPSDASTEGRARTTADDFHRNRAAYQAKRAALASEPGRLDEAIRDREATLEAMREARDRLRARVDEDSAETLPRLRAVTGSVEAFTFRVLQPFVALLTDRPPPGDGSARGNDRVRISADAVSQYISFLLPLTLLLALTGARRFSRALYDRHLHRRRYAIGFLILLLPLSSLAQDNAEAGPAETVGREPPLADMLREADELLGLTRVQRYIRRLSAPDAVGRRIRIFDVDLSATPFTYFNSVVGGSGEYHATLAALHLADGNQPAAIDELRALADPETRYATRDTDSARYESMLSSAAIYLMGSGALGVADAILRLHLQELRSPDTFNALYPELVEHSLTIPAVALARQTLEATSDTKQLLRLTETFYQRGSVALGRSSLIKALSAVEDPRDLRSIIELSLAHREEAVLEKALETAPRVMDDLSGVIAGVDLLRGADRQPAAEALLKGAIERTSKQTVAIVDGESVTGTRALTLLSRAALERGMLGTAESAAVAAIEPLSRAERSALPMRVPEGTLAPGRLPEPDKLVSPLYLGLIYEQQGRSEAARRRISDASRALVENLLETDGLYIPDMMNHLTLLGGLLDPGRDREELAQLDRVLVRLERDALEDLRASRAPATDSRRSRLETADREIAALDAEIAVLEAQLEERRATPLGLAWSTGLLLLRVIGLLALCAACAAAIGSAALHYARGRLRQKGHAFAWKLLEGCGWVWVLSILSAPLGLLAVTCAQFFLLLQEKSERLLAMSEVPQAARSQSESRDEPLTPERGKAEVDGAAEAPDTQWRSVLQMLREV